MSLDDKVRQNMKRLLFSLLATFVSGCHLGQSEETRREAARSAVIKAAAAEEFTGKPVLQSLDRAKDDSNKLLGTYCGTMTDDGIPAADQKPRRFVYMAVDKDVVFELQVDHSSQNGDPELAALAKEASTKFESLWKEGCA